MTPARGVLKSEQYWPTAPPPSRIEEFFWVYAERSQRKLRPKKDTGRSGKFLLFIPLGELDGWCEKVARATSDGKLGPQSKCGTARANPNGNSSRRVICVYTPDSRDEADNRRVREALRELGATESLCYKTDAETLAGHYMNRGNAGPNRWWP